MTKTEYREYLKSDHWQKLRASKFSKSNRRCGICGSMDRLQVHHLNYRNIYDVQPTDLRVLCDRCHNKAHELIKAGKIKLGGKSHHSLWSTTRTAVLISLGLFGVNQFNPHKPSNQKVESNSRTISKDELINSFLESSEAALEEMTSGWREPRSTALTVKMLIDAIGRAKSTGYPKLNVKLTWNQQLREVQRQDKLISRLRLGH